MVNLRHFAAHLSSFLNLTSWWGRESLECTNCSHTKIGVSSLWCERSLYIPSILCPTTCLFPYGQNLIFFTHTHTQKKLVLIFFPYFLQTLSNDLLWAFLEWIHCSARITVETRVDFNILKGCQWKFSVIQVELSEN